MALLEVQGVELSLESGQQRSVFAVVIYQCRALRLLLVYLGWCTIGPAVRVVGREGRAPWLLVSLEAQADLLHGSLSVDVRLTGIDGPGPPVTQVRILGQLRLEPREVVYVPDVTRSQCYRVCARRRRPSTARERSPPGACDADADEDTACERCRAGPELAAATGPAGRHAAIHVLHPSLC